jgi:TRAP-type C4-dicarboxylate transport system substrate-binding protein
LVQNIPEFEKEFAGLKILFVYASDPYHLGSKKPVRNLADLKGMKIRELGGYGTDMWKLLGASPMFIPGPGCYEAAAKGVIDGIGLAWAFNSTFKMYEVLDYWTDVGTNLATFFLIMNQEKWNSLPPDIQQQLMSVSGIYGAEFAGDAQFGLAPKKELQNKIKREGKKWERVELDPGQYERWKEIAGRPLWDKWVAEMESKGLPGRKVLGEYQRLLEKYR